MSSFHAPENRSFCERGILSSTLHMSSSNHSHECPSDINGALLPPLVPQTSAQTATIAIGHGVPHKLRSKHSAVPATTSLTPSPLCCQPHLSTTGTAHPPARPLASLALSPDTLIIPSPRPLPPLFHPPPPPLPPHSPPRSLQVVPYLTPARFRCPGPGRSCSLIPSPGPPFLPHSARQP